MTTEKSVIETSLNEYLEAERKARELLTAKLCMFSKCIELGYESRLGSMSLDERKKAEASYLALRAFINHLQTGHPVSRADADVLVWDLTAGACNKPAPEGKRGARRLI